MIENFDEIVYKYRYIIGVSLIIIILAGLGMLGFDKYRQNNLKQENDKMAVLRLENNQLRQELSQSNVKQIAGVSTSQNQTDKININTATAEELDKIPGIGPARAKLIIDYRTQNNGFKTIEQIKDIKGIGDKSFENIKDLITVGE